VVATSHDYDKLTTALLVSHHICLPAARQPIGPQRLTGFDVESYVRHGLPIVSIVGNNGAWNQTTQGVLKRTGRAIGTYLNQEVDYAKIMDAMGGYGERVTDPDEIKPALDRAFTSGKAAVIDVVIDQEVGYGMMGGRSRQSRQY